MSLTEYFVSDAVEKQVSISVDGMTFTNEDFRSEEMELIEQLCSEPDSVGNKTGTGRFGGKHLCTDCSKHKTDSHEGQQGQHHQ